jgi:hypothetical protein
MLLYFVAVSGFDEIEASNGRQQKSTLGRFRSNTTPKAEQMDGEVVGTYSHVACTNSSNGILALCWCISGTKPGSFPFADPMKWYI